MDLLNANATPAKARRVSRGCRLEVATPFQRLATGIFVTGFAGTVVASRVLAPLNAVGGGGHVSAAPSNFDAPVKLASSEQSGDSASVRMQETRRLLIELRQAVQDIAVADDTSRMKSQARAHEIARSLAAIDRVVSAAELPNARSIALGQCAVPAEPAVAYLHTSDFLQMAVYLSIHGTEGEETFRFLSGSSQGSIVRAINAFTQSTGVEAEPSNQNASRVELRTVEHGSDAFLRVHRIDGNNIIYAEPIGGPALGDLKDYGVNALVLQAVDYASGASQSSIRAAINSFTKTTGIEADQDMMMPDRGQVATVETAQTVVDNQSRLSALDGPALGDLKDYGTNALVLRAIDDESD